MSQSRLMNEVASRYDQWSRTYDNVENATRDLAARVLRQQFPDFRDRDALEIGCGTGLNTRHLADVNRSVLALDFSAGMLEQARVSVKAGNVRFGQQDIQLRWEVADASVDLIVCTLVLEHVADLNHIFSEAARVLRPGGEFFICELHPFRQLQGGQAQFTDTLTGDVVFVPAHLHDVSDYVNAGINHDFAVANIGERRDQEDAQKTAPPRLLSIHFRTRRS